MAQGTIGVNVLPFVGTEGTTIASAPIATFTDSGGVQPAENFTATLTITGPDGFSLTLPAAGISQDGNAALYTVTAPAFTLPQAGHYQVVVSVTDNAGVIPANAQGSSTVAIADAPLTAGGAGPGLGEHRRLHRRDRGRLHRWGRDPAGLQLHLDHRLGRWIAELGRRRLRVRRKLLRAGDAQVRQARHLRDDGRRDRPGWGRDHAQRLDHRHRSLGDRIDPGHHRDPGHRHRPDRPGDVRVPQHPGDGRRPGAPPSRPTAGATAPRPATRSRSCRSASRRCRARPTRVPRSSRCSAVTPTASSPRRARPTPSASSSRPSAGRAPR